MIELTDIPGGAVAPDRQVVSATRSCWLPSTVRSAGRARALLRDLLSEADTSQELFEAAELIVSELVANAVTHARTPGRLIAVVLAISAGRLRIEVHDASDRPAELPLGAGIDSESGRGLLLVDALAVVWGCSPRPGGVGKFVWAVVGPVEGESCVG
ncbi:ATP-binding protein [Kitasatospora sp. NPDC049258]|uniref:ATP-binding protein n=1 Tax=Kitasatospora sp. NPDC049258 TaxID=3155394 RepID=UPI00342934CE